MKSLPPRAVVLSAVAILVLLGVDLWMAPRLALQRSATSFGVGRNGYKAAYDLLSELGIPVKRSYLRPGVIPVRRPLWFVSPSFLEPALQAGVGSGAREVTRWVRAGGTAVIFGGPGSDWKRLGIAHVTSAAGKAEIVAGAFAPRARMLDVTGLMHFVSAGDRARIRLKSDGAPFALDFALGAGHMILIADGRFLLNANLGKDDDSLLLADLVRALGPPSFDEYFHGMVESSSLVATVAGSRVMLPLCVGLLLALLWVGERRSWPPRRPARRSEVPSPSIVSFLDSLGALYGRAGDPVAAFRAYRAGFLHRVGRQLSPRGEFSERLLMERIAHDRSLPAETRHWLIDGATPNSENELIDAVRALESYQGIR